MEPMIDNRSIPAIFKRTWSSKTHASSVSTPKDLPHQGAVKEDMVKQDTCVIRFNAEGLATPGRSEKTPFQTCMIELSAVLAKAILTMDAMAKGSSHSLLRMVVKGPRPSSLPAIPPTPHCDD
jgi:hypothetical protein